MIYFIRIKTNNRSITITETSELTSTILWLVRLTMQGTSKPVNTFQSDDEVALDESEFFSTKMLGTHPNNSHMTRRDKGRSSAVNETAWLAYDTPFRLYFI